MATVLCDQTQERSVAATEIRLDGQDAKRVGIGQIVSALPEIHCASGLRFANLVAILCHCRSCVSRIDHQRSVLNDFVVIKRRVSG